MSFLEKQLNRIFKKILSSAFSLRTHFKSYTDKHHLITPKIKDYLCSKRTSSVIFTYLKGSLSVEAALVIPIFMFALMAVLSFVEMLHLQMAMDSAMHETSKKLATYGYVQNLWSKENIGDLPLPAETLFSEIYVKNQVMETVGSDYLDASPMDGKLSFLGSRILEDDRIELYSTYYVLPFFALSPKTGFLTGQTAVVRAFTGYDNLAGGAAGEKEEYVFITEYGTAYHKDRGCPYLDLSVEKNFTGELASLRNLDGEKYDPCENCVGTVSTDLIFVTNYGDCYHSDILCSGLRRTIQSVPISQVGGRHPCPKCAG